METTVAVVDEVLVRIWEPKNIHGALSLVEGGDISQWNTTL